jgi:hypothetical protein
MLLEDQRAEARGWIHHFDQDAIVVVLLLVCVVICAISLPVSPFPRDGWFETQYHLFGRFPGEDDYAPIAAPAVFYKFVHWLALFAGLDLKRELYLACLAQNCLLFISACYVYHTCKFVSSQKVASFVAISFLLFVLSLGMAQAFWSENVVLVMFAAVLYLNAAIYYERSDSSGVFWRRALFGSLLTGLLVITRITPVLLIPGICLLLHHRLSRKRLAGYAALACLMTGLMLGGMLASNYARFGRAELTNSAGRHLWQGVNPIVDRALAESPEFLELKVLNPDIQSKNWYEVRLPNDRRQEFDGEKLLGRLASQAIRSHPFSYLRLGLTKFVTTIDQPPYRLGSDGRGNHHLLSTDPLKTDSLLPPLGEPVLSGPVTSVAGKAITAAFSLGRMVYPVVVFFVLAAYNALIIRELRLRRGGGSMRRDGLWHLLVGAALLGMVYVNNIFQERAIVWMVRSVCALVLLLQVAIISSDSETCVDERQFEAFPDVVAYSFLVFMFFGSLWLSWQTETRNTRNVLPYLPFLAVMLAMSLRHWLGSAAAWRSLMESHAARGAHGTANTVLRRAPAFAAGPLPPQLRKVLARRMATPANLG